MSKPTILCIDDERMVLNSLRDQLKRHLGNDYYLEIAESGDEALEVFEELLEDGSEVPVVICDQIMPGMKGDEVLIEIHKKYPNTRKIMLTGQASADAVGNALNHANLYRYMAKPWEHTDLNLTVSKALHSYYQDQKLAEQNETLRQMNQELEQLNHAYERFVPTEFTAFLGKSSIIDVQLGDQVSKEMAVMFSDIRSFTALSETMTPQENFDFVNTYLKRVSPMVRDNQGFIVKYLGDGMMAVFPNGADYALRAALDKLKQVSAYNVCRQKKGHQPISVGIGIHVGHMMVGMVGEIARMQGDAFSDHVNLAARLEGLTKLYGVSLIISGKTKNKLTNPDQYQIRFLDRVIVKGRQKPISLFEVLDSEEEANRTLKLQTAAYFEEGIHYYQQKAQFKKARSCFEEVLRRNPSDKTAQIYLERVESFMVNGIPHGWKGVHSLTRK